MIQIRAQKWVGGVSAPIPASIARRLEIVPGTPIEVEELNGTVVITPIRTRQRRTLAQILKSCQQKFPNGSPHGIIDYGNPVGKESW